MGLILITHDLRVAFAMCDRIYVLYAGSVLEVAPAEAVEDEPLHPYTLGLLLSEPPADRRLPQLVAIQGSVPAPDDVPGVARSRRAAVGGRRVPAGPPPLARRRDRPGERLRAHRRDPRRDARAGAGGRRSALTSRPFRSERGRACRRSPTCERS